MWWSAQYRKIQLTMKFQLYYFPAAETWTFKTLKLWLHSVMSEQHVVAEAVKRPASESPCYFSHLRRAVSERERKKRWQAGSLQQQAIATRRGAEKVVVVANLFAQHTAGISLSLVAERERRLIFASECHRALSLERAGRSGAAQGCSLKQAAAINRARLNITPRVRRRALLSSGICIRNTATWHYLHLAAPSSALFAAASHQTFRRRHRWRCFQHLVRCKLGAPHCFDTRLPVWFEALRAKLSLCDAACSTSFLAAVAARFLAGERLWC